MKAGGEVSIHCFVAALRFKSRAVGASLRLLVASQYTPRKSWIELTGRRSYTLIVISVFCKFAEALEDVLLRVRFCFGGPMVFVAARCLTTAMHNNGRVTVSAHVLRSTKCTRYRRDLQRSYAIARNAVVHVDGVHALGTAQPRSIVAPWRCEVGRLDCLERREV